LTGEGENAGEQGKTSSASRGIEGFQTVLIVVISERLRKTRKKKSSDLDRSTIREEDENVRGKRRRTDGKT